MCDANGFYSQLTQLRRIASARLSKVDNMFGDD
jgi:hypothetical protein